MPKSYLNSEPYGLGELIARKKHLRVPPHQRDYAWGEDEVSQLLEDLFIAVDSEHEEYFLGLLVIVGPIDGAWLVLDGQQRVATCTMVLASIRFWLTQLDREDDAVQIQRQFISVRRLGGDDEPRLTMNHTNKDIFSFLLRPNVDSDQVRQLQEEHLPGTSNHKLISAYLKCRSAIGDEMQSMPKPEQDAFLYRLADFIENQAQTVCLEVDQAADAYKIFESLNDRGLALSALDLFKNFAFGTVAENSHTHLSKLWEEMSSQIVDADAEDFLKVVWTAKYGRVQRGALFTLIRREYSTEDDVLELIETLSVQAELYTALLEPSHHVWAQYGKAAAGLVATLRDLRSRQIRPIILSALSHQIPSDDMVYLLNCLLTLTVRYQTVGKGRTGLLEIGCAKAAKALSASPDKVAESLANLQQLIPSNHHFQIDFERYRERNSKRSLQVLLALESTLLHGTYHPDWVFETLSSEDVVVTPLVGKGLSDSWNSLQASDPGFIEDVARRIGNLVLLSRDDARKIRACAPDQVFQLLSESHYKTTSMVTTQLTTEGLWQRTEIENRQSILADLAAKCWPWVKIDEA